MPITNYKMSGIFDVEFEFTLNFDLKPEAYIIVMLPGYDTMFIPPEDTILCYVDDFITPCTRYEGIDWILIKAEVGQLHYYL